MEQEQSSIKAENSQETDVDVNLFSWMFSNLRAAWDSFTTVLDLEQIEKTKADMPVSKFIVPEDQSLSSLPKDVLGHVFLFLTEPELISASEISKECYQLGSEQRNLMYKEWLLNILKLKFQGDAELVEEKMTALLADPSLSASLWPHIQVFKLFRDEASVELKGLGYRDDIIMAIKPELLWAVPSNVSIPRATDDLDYFNPDDVPDGMSRGVDPVGRPAIFFKFKIFSANDRQYKKVSVHDERFPMFSALNSQYDQYEEVSVHHARFPDTTERWVKAGKHNHDKNSRLWMNIIQDGNHDPISAKTYGTDTPLGQILTAYRDSLLKGRSMEAVSVEYQEPWYLSGNGKQPDRKVTL